MRPTAVRRTSQTVAALNRDDRAVLRNSGCCEANSAGKAGSAIVGAWSPEGAPDPRSSGRNADESTGWVYSDDSVLRAFFAGEAESDARSLGGGATDAAV